MRFFWKLSRHQRAEKIACVATLAQVMWQMKTSQEKIARNSVSWIFCDKITDFVRGWLDMWFSPRASDATISKKAHHYRKQKIARVAAALLSLKQVCIAYFQVFYLNAFVKPCSIQRIKPLPSDLFWYFKFSSNNSESAIFCYRLEIHKIVKAWLNIETSRKIFSYSALNLLPNCFSFTWFSERSWIVIETDDWHPPKTLGRLGKNLEGRMLEKTAVKSSEMETHPLRDPKRLPLFHGLTPALRVWSRHALQQTVRACLNQICYRIQTFQLCPGLLFCILCDFLTSCWG